MLTSCAIASAANAAARPDSNEARAPGRPGPDRPAGAGRVHPVLLEAALYTWSVVYTNDLPPFRDRLPYVAAAVDLAEGPRMMTTVVGCDPLTLCVGLRLHVSLPTAALESGDGEQPVAAPVFRPVSR
jgi:hypothetical protein